ncbi:MAG: DUF2378 family protein [Myxococcaceae bacterium]
MPPSQEEQLVYGHTLEGLFKLAIGPKLDDRARARLRENGLDLGRPLQPTYTRRQFRKWVLIAAEEIYPKLSPDQALERIGEHSVEGYVKTLLGKMILATVRVLGPKRTLSRLTQNLSSSGNYFETRATDTGKSSCDLWYNDVGGLTPYYVGMLRMVLRLSGAKNERVEPVPGPGGDCTFRISWS